MEKKTSLRIPGRYLLKLFIEIVLLCAVFLLSTNSNLWLSDTLLIAPTIKTILKFLIVFFGFNLVLRFMAIAYRRRKHLPFSKKDNVTVGLTNIFMLIVSVYALIAVFTLFGIKFSEMFTSLSIGAAAIAIILKDFVADIISGILISFSNELTIGDHVKIGDFRGKIIDINISKTALINDDDHIVFLPNSKVFGSETINYSKKPINKTSIDFELTKEDFSSIEEMEGKLTELLTEYAESIEPLSYYLRVVAIHKDYLELKFQYQLINYDRSLERSIRRKTVRYIANHKSGH